MLNVSKETYKRNAERNRAARANFKRLEPHKYADVPSYMRKDEQYRKSRIEQMRRDSIAQAQLKAVAQLAVMQRKRRSKRRSTPPASSLCVGDPLSES